MIGWYFMNLIRQNAKERLYGVIYVFTVYQRRRKKGYVSNEYLVCLLPCTLNLALKYLSIAKT